MNNLNDIFFAPTENGALTYEQVLEDVQRYFSENHASTIAGAGENDSERAVTVLKELMVQYLVPGLVLAWAYEHSGTLWAAVALHAAANALSIWTMMG